MTAYQGHYREKEKNYVGQNIYSERKSELKLKKTQKRTETKVANYEKKT